MRLNQSFAHPVLHHLLAFALKRLKQESFLALLPEIHFGLMMAVIKTGTFLGPMQPLGWMKQLLSKHIKAHACVLGSPWMGCYQRSKKELCHHCLLLMFQQPMVWLPPFLFLWAFKREGTGGWPDHVVTNMAGASSSSEVTSWHLLWHCDFTILGAATTSDSSRTLCMISCVVANWCGIPCTLLLPASVSTKSCSTQPS